MAFLETYKEIKKENMLIINYIFFKSILYRHSTVSESTKNFHCPWKWWNEHVWSFMKVLYEENEFLKL